MGSTATSATVGIMCRGRMAWKRNGRELSVVAGTLEIGGRRPAPPAPGEL